MSISLILNGDFIGDPDFNNDKLINRLTFSNIIPESITGSIDNYSGKIEIKFNNGDLVYYKYDCDPTGYQWTTPDIYVMKINNRKVEDKDGSDGFLNNLIYKYKEYLDNKNNPLGLSCISAILELKKSNPDLAEKSIREITEMMELIDGAYEAVELYKSDSPYNNNTWKPTWLEKARKYGASPEW